MINLYIDTNIFIKGPDFSEFSNIIDILNKNEAKLFYSLIVRNELKKGEIDYAYGTLKNAQLKARYMDNSEELDQATLGYAALKTRYKNEVDNWSDYSLQFTMSTVEGLVTIAQANPDPDYILSFDHKGEVTRLGNLVEEYNLDHGDAFHLLIAESQGIPYVLTYDKKFIKRAAKVPGFRTKVISPSDLPKS